MELTDTAINDASKWAGKNKLGQILIKIRNQIHKEKLLREKL